VIEVRRSRALRIALGAMLLALPTVLAAVPGREHLVRIGIALLAVILAWRPALDVALGIGKHALRRVEWNSEGPWYLTDEPGTRHAAELEKSSATLGVWLLLTWKSPSGRRFRALIESAATAPAAFRALKGRLNC
jgi:hypothetical protein